MDTKKLIARQISELTIPLGDKALNKLASVLTCTVLKKGEQFLKEGEVCTQIGYVHKGIIRQFYYKNNKELTEFFAYENKLFISLESCFRKRPSHLIIEALEYTIIYGIPYDALIQLTEEDKDIASLYRYILESSLILSQRKTDSFRYETAKERYTRLMKEDPEIIKRAPLSQIASFLLMTPETLSRVRGKKI